MFARKIAARTWHSDVPRSTTLPTLAGLVILFVTVFGFGVWGSAAPIAGAVITTGAFVATGQNRIIQHLEGGVIREILVREGDVVEPDQALIILDETATRAELQRLLVRQARYLASEARLRAEANNLDAPAFPFELTSRRGDPDVDAIIAGQNLAFSARRDNLNSEIATISAGIDALKERIEGSHVQKRAAEQEIRIIEEEIEDKNKLLKSGLVRKPEVLLLQRAKVKLSGEIGRLLGDIGDATERIARAREQIASVRATFVKGVIDQIHEVTAELNDLKERIRAATFILERTTITTPVRGVVAKLRYHTPGGVIEPGRNIMEIVPLHEELVIEARIRPQEIDAVKRGQSAVVRLTALNQRITPMVDGEVMFVSADALPDETRQQMAQAGDQFVVRVRMKPHALREVPDFQPSPGMPAELYIQTAERTFFEYLMQPIKDTFSRAFREP